MPTPLTAGNAILTLDAALEGCSAALVVFGRVVAERTHAGGRGAAAILPRIAQEVLRAGHTTAVDLSAIAVTVGPGSFTGVRAALALAHGIGLAAAVPVVGVCVTDAIRAATHSASPVWVAIDSKRGRIFLDDGAAIRSLSLESLPVPTDPVTMAGDAAEIVIARWRSFGLEACAAPFNGLSSSAIATASQSAPRLPQPLYVDPPEARPTAVLRPAPSS